MQAAATQLRNQAVRDWARDNGFEVSTAGRLPAGIVAAYDAAHPDEAEGEDGPDWQAGAQSLGVALGVQPADPLANDDESEDLTGGGADSPGSTRDPAGRESTLNAGTAAAGQPAGPPPVTSLADARARAAAQPKRPVWAQPPGRDRKASGAKTSSGKGSTARGRAAPHPEIEITPAVRADMQAKLALLLAVPGSAWEMIDQPCGGTFNAELPNISAKLVPVLCQSQAVVRLLTLDDTWFALLGLAVACKPVALAVYRHHFSEEAAAAKRRRQQGGPQQGQGQGGGTAEEDLSAYAVQPQVSGHVPAYRAS